MLIFPWNEDYFIVFVGNINIGGSLSKYHQTAQIAMHAMAIKIWITFKIVEIIYNECEILVAEIGVTSWW